MLPNLALLAQIPQQIFRLQNKRKESKRTEHYCLFLLCYKAGLRVSEAVNFDLSARTQQGLYQITKTKGKKYRLAYIPKQVINELKKYGWKPNSTNRFNFYHFLKKIKRNLNLSRNIELTPHTLRRSFATYHDENGLPLTLLSKLLGHSSVRTTALYWINTYHGGDDDDDSDTDAILVGKDWLENEENPPVQPEAPASSEIPPPPNLLNQLSENLWAEQAINQSLTKALSNCQQQLSEKAQQIELLKKELIQAEEQKATCQTDLADLNERNANLHQEKAKIFAQKQQIQQDLAQAQQTISATQKELASEQAKHLATESKLIQEKQISNDLRHQLQAEQEINANLRQELHAYEQNHTNLINTYQSTLKDKEFAEQQLTKLTGEIKNFAQAFRQWQKINYYQQLEEQNKFQTQIIQSQPPPWKPPN